MWGSNIDFGSDRFEVIRQIGQGGMGIVYEAHDKVRGQRVALKTLRHYDLTTMYRLKREFRVLADLSHPHLIDLYDMVVSEEVCFFTMELVTGTHFIHYCRPQTDASGEELDDTMPALSPEQILGTHFDEARLRHVLPQLVDGVIALHEANMIHRDIKPSNVLVDDNGRVVILDFGLVADVGADLADSLAGQIVGTVEYMAPEQAMAEPIGPAADWYSVGVLLYEALTGTVPHSGTAMQILVGKREHPAPPPHARGPVPEDLDALCLALLRREPEQRPDADQILRRLGLGERPRLDTFSSVSRMADLSIFAGRKHELEQLRKSVNRIGAGAAAVAAIRGPSGIGKSALVRRFLELFRRQVSDAIVLEGRCYETESIPYKAVDAVADQLSRIWSQLPDAQARALLPEDGALLPTLFPVFGRVRCVGEAQSVAVPAVGDPQELRINAFRALREVLTRLAKNTRLVIFLDDLQWADAASIALLSELLRGPNPPPLFMLLCSRDDQRTPRHRAETGESLDERALDRLLPSVGAPAMLLDLGPLGRQDSVSLAEHVLGPGSRDLAERVAEEAGGIPFFVATLALYLQSEAPDDSAPIRLDQVLQHRIDRLAPKAREVLEAIVLSGTPVTQRVLARALGQASEETARIIRQLRTLHLVRAPGGRETEWIETYHDRIRSCVENGLSGAQKQTLYLGLALALEHWDLGSPEYRARLWLGAGDQDKTATYLRQAAELAETALDFDRAAHLYDQTLHCGHFGADEAGALHLSLGNCLANARRPRDAALAFRAASETLTADAIPILYRAGLESLRGGHVAEALHILESVVDNLELKNHADVAQAMSALRRARLRRRLPSLPSRPGARKELSSAVQLQLSVLSTLARALWLIRPACGARYQAAERRLAVRAGDSEHLARALAGDAVYLAFFGWHKEAANLLARAEHTGGSAPSERLAASLSWANGRLAFDHMDAYTPAYQHFEAAAEWARQNHPTGGWEIDPADLDRLHASLYLGHLAEIARSLPHLIESAEARGQDYPAANLRALFNVMWLMADEPDEARRQLQRARRVFLADGATYQQQHLYAMMSEVQIELYLGRTPEARDTLRADGDALAASRLRASPRLHAELTQLEGRVALASAAHTSDPGERARHLAATQASARALVRTQTATGAAWAALLDAGIAQVTGDREAAVTGLHATAEAFTQLGMALYAHAARRQLGRILKGPVGDTRITTADRWLTEQAIQAPARFVKIIAPGFDAGTGEGTAIENLPSAE